jgi:hypothetical protein
MEYAARMPHTPPQVAVFGVVALLAGAGGALGISAIADDNSTPAPEIRVVAAQPVSGVNEAGTAAAIGTEAGSVPGSGPNEAITATSLATGGGGELSSGPNESATASAVATAAPQF